MILMKHNTAVHDVYDWNPTQLFWALHLIVHQTVNAAPSVSTVHYYGNCVCSCSIYIMVIFGKIQLKPSDTLLGQLVNYYLLRTHAVSILECICRQHMSVVERDVIHFSYALAFPKSFALPALEFAPNSIGMGRSNNLETTQRCWMEWKWAHYLWQWG